MRRAVVPTVLAAIVIAALDVFVPHLGTREISYETPVPKPLYQLSLFPVPPRAAACLDQVAVEPGYQAALFTVDTPGPGPPLRFSLHAGSFEQERDLPGGYGTSDLSVPFAGPPRPALAVVCIRNLGDVPVALRGTKEARTLSRPRLTIAGRPAGGEFSLALASTDVKSRTDLVATSARRMSAFKPVWVQPLTVVTLLLVVLLGAFVVPLVALWRAFVLDERQ